VRQPVDEAAPTDHDGPQIRSIRRSRRPRRKTIMPAAKRTMTESFVLLFSFWSLFPNSMARPDVRTHRSHRVAVQQKLTEHRANNTLSRRKEDHLLKDLLFDDAGHCMIATHATKAGVRYRFSRLGLHGEARTAVLGSVSRVPAPEIEQAIVSALQATAMARSGASGIAGNKETVRTERAADAAPPRCRGELVSPYS
jgi:hypothetical protein